METAAVYVEFHMDTGRIIKGYVMCPSPMGAFDGQVFMRTHLQKIIGLSSTFTVIHPHDSEIIFTNHISSIMISPRAPDTGEKIEQMKFG